MSVTVPTLLSAEMQRDHQRREHRLQEAHCCALSTMEEARQHQIRVRRPADGTRRVSTYRHVSLSSSFCPLSSSKALEERLKQEQREEVHALKEAHRRTLDILRQQSEQELQTLRYELEDEGKAKLGG